MFVWFVVKTGNDHEKVVHSKRCWFRRNIHSLNINLYNWIIHFHYTQVVAVAFAAAPVTITLIGRDQWVRFWAFSDTHFVAIINSWWENGIRINANQIRCILGGLAIWCDYQHSTIIILMKTFLNSYRSDSIIQIDLIWLDWIRMDWMCAWISVLAP